MHWRVGNEETVPMLESKTHVRITCMQRFSEIKTDSQIKCEHKETENMLYKKHRNTQDDKTSVAWNLGPSCQEPLKKQK